MRRSAFLLPLLSLGAALCWALGSGCAPEERVFGDTGTAGGGPGCQPGTEAPCYEGPDDTQDVGLCRAGTMRCQDDGSYGACEGQVLPAAELCGTEDDEACDGPSPPCSLGHLWSLGFGEAGDNNVVTSLAAGGDGSVLIAGEMDGTVDFGEGPVMPPDNYSDAFLVKLDAATGEVRWARVYGGLDDQRPGGVAADAAGGAFLAVTVSGTIDVGGVSATSAGGADVVVARVAPDGTTGWVRTAGDADYQYPYGLAITPAGDPVVAGTFGGTLALDGVSMTASDMTADVFVLKLASADGTALWGAQLLGSYPEVTAVTAAPDGDVLVTGSFTGDLTMGNQTVTSLGDSDAFLVKLNGQTGALRWLLSFGGYGSDRATGVAADPSGGIALTGLFTEEVSFGGETLITPSEEAFFLARLGADGAVLSAAQFGGGFGGANRMVVAADSQGDLALAGFFTGSLSFGGDTFMGEGTGFGMIDVFVAKLDAGGGHIASRAFPNDSLQVFSGVAVDATDRIFAGGASLGPLDLGGGPVGSPDPMVASAIVGAYSP